MSDKIKEELITVVKYYCNRIVNYPVICCKGIFIMKLLKDSFNCSFVRRLLMSVCPLHRYILYIWIFLKTDVFLSIYHHHNLVSFFDRDISNFTCHWFRAYMTYTTSNIWILICLTFRSIHTSLFVGFLCISFEFFLLCFV